MRALILLTVVAIAGCDCAGEQPACGAGGACPDAGTDGGLECADDPARVCRNETLCCPEGEECVRGYDCAPLCPNKRCGDNGLGCCAAGQVCLDGVVCAADCADDRAL